MTTSWMTGRALPQRHDYPEPPKDQTVVRVKVLRRCVILNEQRAPGDIVPLPRWLADIVVTGSGRAEMVD
jgi:hypothetical protein